MCSFILSGTEFIVKNNYEPLARRKFKNFADYVSIYPEFKHIFIGDNGQGMFSIEFELTYMYQFESLSTFVVQCIIGDVKAAFYMTASFPDHLQAVYIHLVQPLSQTHGYEGWFWGDDDTSNQEDDSDAASVTSLQSKSSHRSLTSSNIPLTQKYKSVGRSTAILHHIPTHIPLHFFRTYIDAALHAFNHGFIDVSSLLQVCYDAVHDFSRIEVWPSSGSNKHVRELRGIEINNDLFSVNLRLHELYKSGLLPSNVHPLKAEEDIESTDSCLSSLMLKPIFFFFFV